MKTATSSVVFLFDANAEGVPDWYGGEFDPAFLNSFAKADPEGHTSSVICRGDALVAKLAEKVTSIQSSKNRSSHTGAYNMELYKTIIWDFADALSSQWNTVDLETFPMTLANKSVHCISVPTLPIKFRDVIDKNLRGQCGYIGAVEIDLGNPIQRTIFIEHLIKDAVITGGQVVREISWEGERYSVFEGACEFKPNGELWVQFGNLSRLHSLPQVSKLSSRGKVSYERYEGKRSFTLQERIVEALTRASFRMRDTKPFSISAKSDSMNPIEANLPEAKFIKYLLDERHPKGGPKAKFFAEVLGIGPKDWRYLAAQLHDGLLQADLTELKVKHYEDQFGVSFNAVISVKGLNDRIVNLDTNWIMEPGGIPRLSTATPAKKDQQAKHDEFRSTVVSTELDGDAKWEAIYNLATEAGQRAAVAVTPTPMKVVGFAIEMEGQCGFAWVRVPDARRGFAKWLVKQDRNNRHYKSGAAVYAPNPTQSIDRAIAYAKAFAAVLCHHGIDCTVESSLD